MGRRKKRTLVRQGKRMKAVLDFVNQKRAGASKLFIPNRGIMVFAKSIKATPVAVRAALRTLARQGAITFHSKRNKGVTVTVPGTVPAPVEHTPRTQTRTARPAARTGRAFGGITIAGLRSRIQEEVNHIDTQIDAHRKKIAELEGARKMKIEFSMEIDRLSR